MAAKKNANRFFIHIKAETDTVEFTPETNSLSELQCLVGGFIQQLTERESGLVILCDEEARLKDEVPFNNIASWFYEETLLGDVVICKCDYNNGEYVGWTKEECKKVCNDYSLC